MPTVGYFIHFQAGDYIAIRNAQSKKPKIICDTLLKVAKDGKSFDRSIIKLNEEYMKNKQINEAITYVEQLVLIRFILLSIKFFQFRRIKEANIALDTKIVDKNSYLGIIQYQSVLLVNLILMDKNYKFRLLQKSRNEFKFNRYAKF